MKDKEYKIRTLKDIFDLPSFDVMKRCLRELTAVMLSTRGIAELYAGVVRGVAKKVGEKIPDGLQHKWPDEVTWRDDDCGTSTINFKCGTGERFTVEIGHKGSMPDHGKER
jgi:hypothetical protein